MVALQRHAVIIDVIAVVPYVTPQVARRCALYHTTLQLLRRMRK